WGQGNEFGIFFFNDFRHCFSLVLYDPLRNRPGCPNNQCQKEGAYPSTWRDASVVFVCSKAHEREAVPYGFHVTSKDRTPQNSYSSGSASSVISWAWLATKLRQ